MFPLFFTIARNACRPKFAELAKLDRTLGNNGEADHDAAPEDDYPRGRFVLDSARGLLMARGELVRRLG